VEAIILAGGLGTRLSSVVPSLPKPMAPISGKPFLELLLESLYKKGFSSIILSVGHLSEKIISHFGGRYKGIAITYVVEKIPLGTGGAIREALKKASQDHAYIFNGDTFVDFNVEGSERLWNEVHSPIIIGSKVNDVGRYGKLLTDGERIIGFSEKGLIGPGIINAGCYVVPVSLASQLPGVENFSFENDFLSQNVTQKNYYLYLASGVFIDIGIPEDYFRAQVELAIFSGTSDEQ
jgi:D-glycero-alpha-D-manno-heptose 1-phosphate guanylyltransferase